MTTRGILGAAAVLVLSAPVVVFPAESIAAGERQPRAETRRAWARHVSSVEAALRADAGAAFTNGSVLQGRRIAVPGGMVHEWRGAITIPAITVRRLVDALSTPGLPPPADDILEARVMSRSGDDLRVYMKVKRTALLTVVYETEHEVSFTRHSDRLATSRSVATRISEIDGSDRGFLWRLNSYWTYRQVGDAVEVSLLTLSLSRDIPLLAR
ncbi:MAG: hypothetical protein AB7J63_09430, partial [Vicinamibacterales bacterium]